ncbi:myo-inositol 2-dehydrogenase/D-chiro-inositol 1-dehydrogenase [Haloactinopolyspora alba]|uniref:Myo-inositol 2-dehydrogenase/D-chiro-inositol 1-dehydrogenase n=1 Tax=Haloactinopolyspora alba TaxID=648780 RepID=A0A2P8DZT4_9ACTN|nr:Gfo/Idh/MocA family oxidoreductase [Haloactinopolyspora alba]PSL02733.1 myo-inositol 2-dehydrogenase/D-chiro-inositol 1-dehydrogenase [Haloactinopolyspora alba]
MRVGFVGVGRIGAAHAQVVRDHPAVSEVRIADADPARARVVADDLGVTALDRTADAFSGVDAVVVAAATSAHAELLTAAARAGLPVFCEKPVAPDIAGTLDVLDEVTKADIPHQIGFQRRFDAGYTAARQALAAGALGELRRAHVITADAEPPPPSYVPTSGGIFRDCHVHDFDVLRWVTGREVVDVYATGANRGAAVFGDNGDVDESAAVLTLDDGTLATVQGSRYNGGGYDVRMELAGTAGTHVVGLDEHAALISAEPDVAFPSGNPFREFWSRFRPAYQAEINAFVELARGERESACTVADALETSYVAEAATLSRAQHRPVRIDEVRHR